MNLKKSIITGIITLLLLCIIQTNEAFGQKLTGQQIKDTLIAELKLNKGRTMGQNPSSILHIYSVEVPADATILQREKNYNYEVYPVYITYAYRTSNYKIVKQKVPFDVIVYLNPKNAYASMNKQSDKITKFKTTVYWQYEEMNKEFDNTLDGMKNLSNANLEEIYGTEDNFPAKWKNEIPHP